MSFRSVHFDGRNRARTDGEPGGAFDPNPNVRNGFVLEGGFALFQPPPDPVFFFKPINAALVFADSRFTSTPGQAGIFTPQLAGPNDAAWSFGPDAVAASVIVKGSVFDDTSGVFAGDLSDADIAVSNSTFRRRDFGVSLWTNYQATDGASIGYPAAVPSRVTIDHSTFDDLNVASIWMDAYVGPPPIDLKVSHNESVLSGPSQVAILGNSLAGARIVNNEFEGEGYGAVVAVTSAGWRIRDNDFCDLSIPPSAESYPFLGLPVNETQAPIVLVDSVADQISHNDCASVYSTP